VSFTVALEVYNSVDPHRTIFIDRGDTFRNKTLQYKSASNNAEA